MTDKKEFFDLKLTPITKIKFLPSCNIKVKHYNNGMKSQDILIPADLTKSIVSIPVKMNGVHIDKVMIIKRGGELYKKLSEANGGILPEYIIENE